MTKEKEICYELIQAGDRQFLEYLINQNIEWLAKVAYSIVKNYNIFDNINDVYYYVYLAFLNLKKIKKEMFERYWFKKLILFLVKQQMIIQIRKSLSNKKILWKKLISWDQEKEYYGSNNILEQEKNMNRKMEVELLLENNQDKINKLKPKERAIFEDYYFSNYSTKQLIEKYPNLTKNTIRTILNKIKRTLRSFKVQ